MASGTQIRVSDLLKTVPAPVRPIVQAARRTITDIAPVATEVVCMTNPPRSKTYMWKLFRYTVDEANVLGIGTFAEHSTIFFYRGRELDDGSGMLQGAGKESRYITLRSASDAERQAVKRMVRKAFTLGGARKA